MNDEINPIEITVKYLLPEHKRDFDLAQHADELYQCLRDLDEHCRRIVKYEEDSRDRMLLADALRQMIADRVGHILWEY